MPVDRFFDYEEDHHDDRYDGCRHRERTENHFCIECGEYLGLRRIFEDLHGNKKPDPAYFEDEESLREAAARILTAPLRCGEPLSPLCCALSDLFEPVVICERAVTEQADETDLSVDYTFHVWNGYGRRTRASGSRRWRR